ncbi:hypothetical protein ACFL0H_10575 [Thermodesulfobacteriota bacterium]
MKKDGIFPIISIMAIFLLAWGCAAGMGSSGRVAEGLVNYTNHGLLRIAELEKKSLEHYASVIGENYTTDQRVQEALKNYVIPLYKRFLDGLRDIRPGAEEIRSVHGIYIRGAGLIYDGFKTKMLGIEMNNENVIIQGNEKIEKGREEVKKWRLALIDLYKKYGVTEIKEKE